MKESAFTTKSIVDMFSAQLNKSQSQDERALSTPSFAIFPPKHKVKETKLESQTRTVHDSEGRERERNLIAFCGCMPDGRRDDPRLFK